MSYEEQESRRSKVVVETPTSRREVTQTDAVRRPDRDGISGATVGVIVVGAIALVTIIVLLLMNNQANEDINANLAAQAAQQPPQTIVQQPAPQQQQPPVIIQQPAPAQAPIIITQPAATAGGSTSRASEDSAIQLDIDKRINDDPTYSTLGLNVTVIDGKATLMGTVRTDSLKSQIEKMIRSVRGVRDIDNQIIVSG